MEFGVDNEYVWVLGVVGGVLGLVVWTAWAWGCFSTVSYGSGANPIFNKYLLANPPSRRSRTERLPAGWVYAGKRATPAEVNGEETLDDETKLPLRGTLVGRQTWKFDPEAYAKACGASSRTGDPALGPLTFNPAENPHSGDRVLRGQMLARYGSEVAKEVGESERRGEEEGAKVGVTEAMRSGLRHMELLQSEDGHWPGDYGGPFFLLPGLVITCFVTGFDLGPHRREAMLLYLRNHQQEDGGWPLHLEGPSTMFGTVLNYVAARLMGRPAGHKDMVRARTFIREHGGAVSTPQWGKIWLCVLGVFEWEGVNAVPPELWLLPRWFPFHPGRMWVHSRMVYLPMSWLYGMRATAEIGEIQEALRRELYVQDYDAIDWNAQRNNVADIDLYSPHTKLMDMLMEVLAVYEKCPLRSLRRPALDFALQYMEAEDEQTNFIDIGPVNKVMNMLCCWFVHGPDSKAFQMHCARVDDYLWVAEDGMKMQGYNGSQLWDCAFATQAVCESGLAVEFPRLLRRANAYIDASQIRENEINAAYWFRCPSKGAWPFSSFDHGHPIADCTAEGLKSCLAARATGVVPDRELVPPGRLYQAVDRILWFQNPDGGWATYERNRGYAWYEWLNPAEVFGDIMIDYTYTELSSTCIEVLREVQETFPHYRPADISRSIRRGVDFVRAQQRPDGSYYGSWAVCFTYGAWFASIALTTGGDPTGKDKDRIDRLCAFLLSKQRSDGGWGESYMSCVKKTYADHPSTNFNTSWALLALINCQCPDADAVARGILWLLASQLTCGDWAQESVAGVFNRSTAITYSNYRNAFPIRALAAYANNYNHTYPELVQGGAAALKRARQLRQDALPTPQPPKSSKRSKTPTRN